MTKSDRLEILQVVEGQIDDIHKELAIQVERMAQLQAHVDDVRAKVKQLIGGAGTTGSPRRTNTDLKA